MIDQNNIRNNNSVDGIGKVVRLTRPAVRSAGQKSKSRDVFFRNGMDGIRRLDVVLVKVAKKTLAYSTPLFVPHAPHALSQHIAVAKKRFRRYRAKLYKQVILFRNQPRINHRALLMVGMVIACVSFSGGAYVEWTSRSSQAQSGPGSQVLGTSSFVGPIDSISPQETLQTFISLLDREKEIPTSADRYDERKGKIQKYLASKKSPLAQDDTALDALMHTKNLKMILAISFVESNFAKHCADNNCSGIGVEPGHPHWRKYKSLANWVLSFDGLLERRYKGWTPEEMRGVYVYPGSDNWVNGVQQVLAELKAAGIE